MSSLSRASIALPLLLCLPLLVCRSADDGSVRAPDVSLRYDSADFTGHEVKREPKLTKKENDGVPVDVAPLRTTIVLHSRLSRANQATIETVPLHDTGVPNFAKAYPEVAQYAAKLKSALQNPRRLDSKLIEASDRHCIDGEHSLHTRFEFVDGPAISGFVFLAQYTQEQHPDPANNEQLVYVFLGLAKDGSHYVEAEFPVSHPSLPRNVDAVAAITRDNAGEYLRKAEKQLAAWDEGTFQPSLTHLKTLVRSIEFPR